MATFQQFSITPQGGPQRRGKVKTGCGTCRTRKVKCDEAKPSCQKCVSTGRTCDGYASPFRFYGGDATKSSPPAAQANKPVHTTPVSTTSDVSPDEVASLQRCFSTKTLFEYVTLGCDDEARQVLQASLTDPAIRHAVSSLRALRDDLETSCPIMPATTSTTSSISSAISSAASSPQAYSPACMSSSVSSYESVSSSSPAYGYGLQQYCLALGGLASHLSAIDSSTNTASDPSDIKGIRSALLCCQVFISIEQVRSNYAAMAQHIIQGLRILYEHRERLQQQHQRLQQSIGAEDDNTLPALDVFVIKLFAAPCKFADVPQPGTIDSDAISLSIEGSVSDSGTRMRVIAPDMRTELTRLSASVLSYLAKVSLANPADAASYEKLMTEQKSLLASLNLWLTNLEKQQLAKGLRLELLSVSFLRFFHRILRVVLLSTQRGGGIDKTELLGPEYAELQSIASTLGERVKSYGTAQDHAHGSNGSDGEREG
ncbi:hypothetical protein SEUCBS139899_008834 [Sporothrix eucalyptigena]|uniref:Zn(2)-C6 fungal-type domain-containing protein n=1 Tax=Sporothrix eucalyptigena TaxID=1812306 RepID=A0ABP0CEV6_9PEZI